MGHRADGFGLTDIGRVRRRNEDAFHLTEDRLLGVIADGMGGGPAGDVAARTAVEGAVDHLSTTRSVLEVAPLDELYETLLHDHARQAVLTANRRVIERADADPTMRGMGCTLTVLLLDPRSERFVIGHIGDSRAYRLSADRIEQLTDDHTLAQESVEQGRLTAEAARDHPFGHILTQVVGLDDRIDPQTVSGRLRPGDTFLLCTDGLIRVLRDSELLSAVGASNDLATTAQWLLDEANRRGGPDNATLVLIRFAGR